MSSVLLQLIPLGLGAIAPVMIVIIVLFLTAKGGMTKSLAFIIGKYVAYVLWGIVLLRFGERASTVEGSGETSNARLIISAIIGGLLLIMAIKTFVGEEDPDAGPSKLQTTLEKLSSGKLLAGGFGLSIIQLRFVALMLVGATIISEAQLPAGQNVVAILVLAFLMVWPLLIPVVVYLTMGERRDAAMQSMNSWLSRNSRLINVGVYGVFGVVLLWQGVSGLFLG
jgi:hypothetical protein